MTRHVLRAFSTSHSGHLSLRQITGALSFVVGEIFGAGTTVIGAYAICNIGTLFSGIGRALGQTGLHSGTAIFSRRTGTIFVVVANSTRILSACSIGARREAG